MGCETEQTPRRSRPAGFVSYPDLSKRDFAFTDAAAEAVRLSLRREAVASFEIHFHSGGERVRVDIFSAGGLCGFWQSSSNGTRQLNLFPSAALREVLVARANAIAESHETATLHVVGEKVREVTLDEFLDEVRTILARS